MIEVSIESDEAINRIPHEDIIIMNYLSVVDIMVERLSDISS